MNESIPFDLLIHVVEFPGRTIIPKENFLDRLIRYLPYLIQYDLKGEHGGTERLLLLNRLYQPLGMPTRTLDYKDLPEDWWLPSEDFIPNFPPQDKHGRHWLYKSFFDFDTGRNGSAYKKYKAKTLLPIKRILGETRIVYGGASFNYLAMR